MLHLLLLAFVGGLYVLVLVLALSLVSGWRPHDAREIVVNHAFNEFVSEGERIPGRHRAGLPGRSSISSRPLMTHAAN
jgi:hypothetical protein